MGGIDFATLVNWIVIASISFIFGIFTDRIRTDRERKEDEKLKLRSLLIRGIDNPERAIESLRELGNKLRTERFGTYADAPFELYALPVIEHVMEIVDPRHSRLANGG